MAIRYGVLCLLPLFAFMPTQCAPKSRKHDSPHTVYDQKQTGDYNIQLHLKDFQIIALLADDSGAFGDYDYNYDYSDLTVKPPSPATPKPLEVSTAPSAPTVPTAPETPPSPKPSDRPQPIVPPTTEHPQPPKRDENSTTESADKTTVANDLEAFPTQSPPKAGETHSPGKIKVQIVGAPMGVGIVPGEDSHEDNEALNLGEASSSRRCSSGFTRDKRGRCRRVRRPGKGSSQLPYGFSRLASSLASRFRQASSQTSLSSSSESVEN